MAKMEELPDCVLEEIMTYLSMRDHASCMDVCQRWRTEIIRLFSLPHHFSVTKCTTRHLFIRHAAHFHQLQDLAVNVSISGEELDMVFTSIPDLKKLSVVMRKPFFSLSPTNLRELKMKLLDKVEINIFQQIALWAPKLTHLSLNKLVSMGNGCLDSLGNYFPYLLSLSLENSKFGTEESWADGECLSSMTSLQSVTILNINLRLSEAGVQNILETLLDLQSLYLDGSSTQLLISEEVHLALKQAPSLRHLAMNCYQLSDGTLKAFSLMNHLEYLHLTVSIVGHLSVAGILFLHDCFHPDFKLKLSWSFAWVAPGLAIRLRAVDRQPDPGVANDMGVGIQHLGLVLQFPHLCVEIVKAFATLPSLKVLNLRRWNNDLTDIDFTHFLHNAIHLEELRVTNIYQWNRKFKDILHNLHLLKRITLESCLPSAYVRSTSVIECLQRFSNLETITLINISNFNPEEVKSEVSAALFRKVIVR